MRLGLLLALLSCISAGIFASENELAYLDISIDPCQDFYQFACGNFKNVHPRPNTTNIVDQFTLLEKDLIKIGKEILSSPKCKDDPVALKKAKSAYKGCTNENNVKPSIVPELRIVNEFGGMPLISSTNETVKFSWNDIGDLVGKYGVQLIFIFSIVQLEQNESVIMVNTDKISNPSLFRLQHSKSYEEVLDADFRKGKPAAFDIFLRTVAYNLLKRTNSNKTEEEVIADLEQVRQFSIKLNNIGKASFQLNEEVLPQKSLLTLKELQEWTDSLFGETINWVEYFGRIFQLTDLMVDGSFKFYHQGIEKVYAVLDLVRKTDPKVLKNFALLRVFLFQAPDSDSTTRKAFEDYYKAKNLRLYPRWEYCTRKILDFVDTATLSYAVTYAYKQSIDPTRIPQAANLVSDIRNAFKDILVTSDWLDDESRDAALKKVHNMLVLLGHPDFVNDRTQLDRFYEKLRICEWDNYGNARNLRAFKMAYQYSQLGTSSRDFWGKSTFDPNAYYNRPNNKIVIPIAMLNPAFFSGTNTIIDYSRLGSIIGHEITHGFDENGKNYDEDGLRKPWWTPETMDTFVEKSQCFKDQYSKYQVLEVNDYVNGSSTVNENLADNGGIRISYKAFKTIMANQSVGTYTADQLFFIGYATMWCSDESQAALTHLTGDQSSYPPNRYRVIGSLSNMAEFSEAFNCPMGSEMNPENKCVLW